MRKLKLDIDELEVDSFEATAEDEARGTVLGLSTDGCPPASDTQYTACGSCNHPNTICADTCNPVVLSCGPECA